MTLDGPQRKGDLRRSRAARREHRAQLHRRCQGHRPGYSRAEGKLIGAAQRVPTPHRLHHHPERCGEGPCDCGADQRPDEG